MPALRSPARSLSRPSVLLPPQGSSYERRGGRQDASVMLPIVLPVLCPQRRCHQPCSVLLATSGAQGAGRMSCPSTPGCHCQVTCITAEMTAVYGRSCTEPRCARVDRELTALDWSSQGDEPPTVEFWSAVGPRLHENSLCAELNEILLSYTVWSACSKSPSLLLPSPTSNIHEYYAE